MDKFLEYLAVNNTIQNWDVYGEKAHNYYLYADPSDSDRFSWFPWDLNESFTSSDLCLSLNVGTDYSKGVYNGWPLLNNILGQSDYRALYDEKLESYFDTSGTPLLAYSTFNSWISTYSSLIEDYVLAEEVGYSWHDDNYSSSDFDEDVDDLKGQVSTRISSVTSYLSD